jgi:hypothetical protein
MDQPKRLPPMPARDDVREDERDRYDAVVERQARLWQGAHTDSNVYFGALLNSPIAAAGLVDMGRIVREGERRGSYTDAQRELVDMVYSTDFGYNTIIKLHLPDAISVGVRLEAVEAIRAGDESALTEEEALIAGYARAVAAGTVDDEVFAAMEALMGRRGVVDFTVFCGFLLNTFRLWQALGVPDTSDAEIEAMLAGYRAGDGPIFDPAARIG